jgi:hypothetical protein
VRAKKFMHSFGASSWAAHTNVSLLEMILDFEVLKVKILKTPHDLVRGEACQPNNRGTPALAPNWRFDLPAHFQ